MAAAPRFVSALLSGFAAPAPHPAIRGFAAYFNAYTQTERLPHNLCGIKSDPNREDDAQYIVSLVGPRAA